MKRVSILGFPLSIGKYEDFVSEIIEAARNFDNRYVCVANVHMFIEAFRNNAFLKNIDGADLITPDGQPLAWAVRRLKGIRQERVAGMDLLPSLLSKSAEQKLSIYMYGGSDELLRQTEQYLAREYPALLVAGMYSPPFRKLTATEQDEIVQNISLAQPNLIFVVLGCPKQENWMASMKGRINGVMIGIGGALPVLVGAQKRAPVWMQRVGLEWLYRLAQEPKRLFKRYAITNTLFIYLISREMLKKMFFSRKYLTNDRI